MWSESERRGLLSGKSQVLDSFASQCQAQSPGRKEGRKEGEREGREDRRKRNLQAPPLPILIW